MRPKRYNRSVAPQRTLATCVNLEKPQFSVGATASPKKIDTEKAPTSEMRAAAGAFFSQRVYKLPCLDASKLRKEERAFGYKRRKMMLDLHCAKLHPGPTCTLLWALRRRMPCELRSAVV